MNSNKKTGKIEVAEEEYSFGYQIVTFLDLAGQQKALGRVQKLPMTEEDRDAALRMLRDTMGRVIFLRKYFEDNFGALGPIDFTQVDISEHLKARIKSATTPALKFHGFSDSLVIWLPTTLSDTNEAPRVLKSLWSMLFTTASAIPCFLALETPVRGGVALDLGTTVIPGGTEIYGRSLSCAYNLESEVAVYPRVVVSPQVVDYLVQMLTVEFDELWLTTLTHHYAKACQDLIVQDEDGQYVVHYLGSTIKRFAAEFNHGESFIERVILPARDFVYRGAHKHKEDEKLGKRYDHLKSYFDKYIGHWQ